MTKHPVTKISARSARWSHRSAARSGRRSSSALRHPLSLSHSSFVIRHSASPGYTLIEMLLALAVLAAVAAITWPAMTRVYADRQLREGAERARVLAASSRLRAIDAGLIYQFRYEPGGRRYVVAPYERGIADAGASTNVVADPTEAASIAESGQLPEGVMFAASGVESYTGERLDPALLAELPDALGLSQASWSAPLLFFPDGTAEDATLTIVDEREQSIDLTIRGLTGAVTVGPVTREASRW